MLQWEHRNKAKNYWGTRERDILGNKGTWLSFVRKQENKVKTLKHMTSCKKPDFGRLAAT